MHIWGGKRLKFQKLKVYETEQYFYYNIFASFINQNKIIFKINSWKKPTQPKKSKFQILFYTKSLPQDFILGTLVQTKAPSTLWCE